MEIKKIFQISSYECEIKPIEIESPNNEQYEIRAEEFEERISRINIQKQKAYREAEGVFIY